MIKRIVLISLVLMYTQSFGQSKIKNRLAIGYNAEYFPGNSEGRFGLKENIVATHFEHFIYGNYKIHQRISAHLGFGYMDNEIVTSINPSSAVDTTGAQVRSFSAKIGVNFHLKKGLAPTGNFFGLYLKYQTLSISNLDYYKFFSFEKNNESINNYAQLTEENFQMNSILLGVQYNFCYAPFTSLPIYLNAGIGLYIPIVTTFSSPEITTSRSPTPGSWSEPAQLDEANFEAETVFLEKSLFYKRLNIVRVNLGISYCF